MCLMQHAWPGRFWHGTSIHFSLICLSVPLWVQAIVCCWIIYQLITQCLLLLASGDTVKRKKPTRLKPIESAPQQNGQLDSFKQPKKDRENFRKTLVDIILWVSFDFCSPGFSQWQIDFFQFTSSQICTFGCIHLWLHKLKKFTYMNIHTFTHT